MAAAQVLLYPSQANRRTDTFDGIDVCGARLADEMRGVVARHPACSASLWSGTAWVRGGAQRGGLRRGG